MWCYAVQTVQGLKELYDTEAGPANQTALEFYGIELPGNLTSLTPPGEPASRPLSAILHCPATVCTSELPFHPSR